MKRVYFCLRVLIFSVALNNGYSQDVVNQESEATKNEAILESCDGYLKGAVGYNAAVSCIEIIGGGLLGIGVSMVNDNEMPVAIGFLVGFGGMEMSKFVPIPLTKARRNLDLLGPFWKDSLEYARLHHKVVTAESLGYATMTLAFAGQALAFLGVVIDQNSNARTALLACGISCAIASIGTSVGSAVTAQMARVDLRKSAGSIGVGIGPQGIGAVYKFP
jgi:hypothetical protein